MSSVIGRWRMMIVTTIPLLLVGCGSRDGKNGAVASRSQANSAYCTPNYSVAPLPNTQSGNFNSTNEVCFVVQNNGPLGFNCSNMQGRTVTVNGTPYSSSACVGGVTVPNTNGGQYYFDVSAGGLSYASIAFWAESGSGGSGGSAGLDGTCTATLSAGQVWSDRYNLNVSVTDTNNWRVTMTYPNQETMIATWNINASWPQSNVLVATPNGSGNNWGVTIKPNGNWTWPTVTCEVDLIALENRYDAGTVAQGAALHGKYFGGVSDNPTSTLSLHFSAITPENSGKWDTIHSSENSYNFTTFENVINFGKQQNPPLLIRGHTLVWSKQLPSWVGNSMNNASQMKTVIENHIHTILDRAIGKYWQGNGSKPYSNEPWGLYAYDVVNEGFLQDGSRRPAGMPAQGDFSDDHSPFEKSLSGPNYVPGGTSYTKNDWIYIAFRAARDHLNTHWATDNRPLLCYNDFEIENVNTKSDAVYDLIKWLNTVDGEQLVDCIGMQGHFREDEASHLPNAIPDEVTPGKTVLDNMERFADLGLEIQVTELDARASMGAYNGVTQDDAFRIITEACLRTTRCAGITQWGVLDTDSWIVKGGATSEAPLLLDGSGNKKAVYSTVYGVLQQDDFTVVPWGLPGPGGTTSWAQIDDAASGYSCYSGDHERCTWLYPHNTAVTLNGSCGGGTGTGIWDNCPSPSGNVCYTTSDYLAWVAYHCE